MGIWLLLALSSGLLLASAWGATRNRPRLGMLLAGMVLLALIGKALLNWQPYWEALLFPWTWYIYIQGWALYWTAMIFFGLAVPRLSIRWNRWAIVAIAGILLGYGLWNHRWIAWPEDYGDDRTVDVQGHLHQSTGYTCAPAACAMALAKVGIVKSEREMARLCLTRRSGTTAYNIYRGLVFALDGTPWEARFAPGNAESLGRAGEIAVIGTMGGRHAVCTVGTGEGVTLFDPLMQSPVILSRQESSWQFAPPAVVLRRR